MSRTHQKGFPTLGFSELGVTIKSLQNFWSKEWTTFYGVNFSEEQLREAAKFPKAILKILNSPCPFYKDKLVKDTHFTFLGLERINNEPLTICKWMELHPESGQPPFRPISFSFDDHLFMRESFANHLSTCAFRWYLMLLEVVPDSTNKTFAEQKAMLPPDYEVPLAIEEVTKLILYYKKNGIYLNPKMYSRCQDVISDRKCRVSVGHFDDKGLDFEDGHDNCRYYRIGVAASRKVLNL